MQEIKPSAFHEITKEIELVLLNNKKLLEKWNNLTDIQRNEWLCWITMSKKDKTRLNRLKRMQSEIVYGAKKPCCWPGCPHRNPNRAEFFS